MTATGIAGIGASKQKMSMGSSPRAQISEIVLSQEESDVMRGWCQQGAEDPYASDDASYDRQLKARLDDVPERVGGLGRAFGNNIGSSGAWRVRGLPIPSDLPSTPGVPYSEIRIPTGTEALLLGVSLFVGDIIAFKAWRGGDRVHNIYPLPQDAETQKASGSVRLAMHTEAAFRPGAPDALALLCLRDGSHPPSTGFCDLLPIWDRLDARTRALLAEPAFGMPGGRDGAIPAEDLRPVVTTNAAGVQFQYDTSASGATPGHQEALRRLRGGIEETASEITLRPGDLVLIDNTHMVHGRTPFAPSYQGGDRWLQRCLIRSRAGSIAA